MSGDALKCTIFGASGFIGRHLGRRLIERGDHCAGFDIHDGKETTGDGGKLVWSRCDVTSDAVDIPAGTDFVYYLSQSPHYRAFPERADDLFRVNAIGALRVAMAAADAGVRGFCYASTGNVYAPGFEPMGEHRERRRDDPYALSKVVAEDMLRLLGDRLPLTIVRLFGVFGPGQKSMLVPAIAARVGRREPVTLQPHPEDGADADGLRISLAYVDDVVSVLVELARRAAGGDGVTGPLNVGGPEPISMRRLATRIGEVLGIEPEFAPVPQPRPSDYVADIGRLRDVLAPSFTSFDDAIARTVSGTD